MSEPESLACELESASSEYHQKNFSALEIRLDRILSANPRNAEALHLLGCMHKDKGDLDRAIELIQASVDNDASNPLSLLNLGKLLNLKGEYHLSAPILHESLRLNPNIVETWFCYGNSLMKVDPSHSIRIFRHVLKLNYKHLGASLNLGALLTRFNHIEEAKQVFSDACMIYPRNTKLRIGFARLFAQIQQHNLAFIQLSYCMDQDLTDEEILAFSLEQLLCIGKKEDRIECYKTALELNIKSPEIFIEFGHIFEENGCSNLAIDAFKKAILEDPHSAEAHFSLACIFSKAGNTKKMLLHLSSAISLKPNHVSAHYMLGAYEAKNGNFQEAISSLQLVVDLKPTLLDAWLLLASVLMDAGRVTESIEAFLVCSNLNPWDPKFLETAALGCYSYAIKNQDPDLLKLSENLYKKSYSVRPLITGFSFSSVGEQAELITSSSLAELLPSNAELIPSYLYLEQPEPLSISYLHIPKTGGMRFTLPLQECIRQYENIIENGQCHLWKKKVRINHQYTRLTSPRINNKNLYSLLLKSLDSLGSDQTIDWSLIMSHGEWATNPIFNQIEESTNLSPKRLATWREPRERFLSSLSYLYRESGGSLSRVRESLTQKVSFLDNSIYRYVYDVFAEASFDKIDRSQPTVDYLFDINNSSSVSRIQSSFLSRNKLPNVILSQKFNMTKGAHKLSTDQENELLDEFFIDDFIRFDKAVEINSLLESQVPSDLDFSACSDEIHPLTVIVADSTGQTNSFNSVSIIPTVDLMDEDGKQKLASIFKNANINQ